MHNPAIKNTFQYLGSKYSVLPWLLKLLPETVHFIEVFGGSMVVTINRPVSQIETYNDINQRVVNFFRCLRNEPDELMRLLQLTPYSRAEYNDAWDDDDQSDVERARRFLE